MRIYIMETWYIITLIVIIIIIIAAIIGAIYYFWYSSSDKILTIWETDLTDVHKMNIISDNIPPPDPVDPTVVWKVFAKIIVPRKAPSNVWQPMYVYQDDFTDAFIFSRIKLDKLPQDYNYMGEYFISTASAKDLTKINVMQGIYGEKEINWLELGDKTNVKFSFWAKLVE